MRPRGGDRRTVESLTAEPDGSCGDEGGPGEREPRDPGTAQGKRLALQQNAVPAKPGVAAMTTKETHDGRRYAGWCDPERLEIWLWALHDRLQQEGVASWLLTNLHGKLKALTDARATAVEACRDAGTWLSPLYGRTGTPAKAEDISAYLLREAAAASLPTPRTKVATVAPMPGPEGVPGRKAETHPEWNAGSDGPGLNSHALAVWAGQIPMMLTAMNVVVRRGPEEGPFLVRTTPLWSRMSRVGDTMIPSVLVCGGPPPDARSEAAAMARTLVEVCRGIRTVLGSAPDGTAAETIEEAAADANRAAEALGSPERGFRWLGAPAAPLTAEDLLRAPVTARRGPRHEKQGRRG